MAKKLRVFTSEAGEETKMRKGNFSNGISFTYPLANDLLDSKILALVQQQKTLASENHETVDYLLTFVAAVIIAKFAVATCGLREPVL